MGVACTERLKAGTRNKDRILRHVRWRSTALLLGNGQTTVRSRIGAVLLVGEVLFAFKVSAPRMALEITSYLWLAALIGAVFWILGQIRHWPGPSWAGYYASWLALAGVILGVPNCRNVGRSLLVIGTVLSALDMPSQMGFAGMAAWGVVVSISIECYHLKLVQSQWASAGGVSIYMFTSLVLLYCLRFLENLYGSSFSDDLTGIGSRQLLRWLRDSLWPIIQKEGRSISILLLDLDDFKAVNDHLGHAYGDAVLRRFAEAIQSEIRHQDVFCRYGGDEFVVTLPDTTATEATVVAHRLRKRVAEVFQKELPDCPITVSVGVASHPEHGYTLEELLAQADQALMMGAKRRGGNQVASVTSFSAPNLWEQIRAELPSDVLPLLEVVSLITGETVEHMTRLARLGSGLGEAMGLTQELCTTIMQAAALHDVGKIAIPKVILEKPGPLTWEERQIMMTHSEIGATMLANLNVEPAVVEAVRYHHEWWDGRGYPDGLREDDIPLAATILAVVDAYDAMTNHRPYQELRTSKAALQEIKDKAGIQFNPHVIALLPQLLEGDALLEVAVETTDIPSR